MNLYFELSDNYQEIIGFVKGIKSQIAIQKEKLVSAIENIKDILSVENALKIYNISREHIIIIKFGN